MSQPLLKDDVTTRLITSFKKLIGDGVLRPGSRLPSERDLAVRFAVSRSSLRQAFKVLDIMGVIVQRVGDGTYVSNGAPSILSDPLEFLALLDGISHHELFEARAIFEPELAARAAERATTDDLRELRRTLSAMKKTRKSPQLFIEHDVAFHESIAVAAGNRVCQLMLAAIRQALKVSISQTSQAVPPEHTIDYHESIYSAVHDRKPQQARDRMAEHLADARKMLPVSRREGAGSQRAGVTLSKNDREGDPPAASLPLGAEAEVTRLFPSLGETADLKYDQGVTGNLVGHFKRLVSDKTLLPGSRLPSERALAQRLKVSRASIREALKVMEIMGVVRQRVGDGSYLSSQAETILSWPMDFLLQLNGIANHELYETRLLIEPKLAEFAARRATDDDLKSLSESVSALRDLKPRSKSFRQDRIRYDTAFHDAIFRAAGNRVCYLMFSVILRLLMDSMVPLVDRVDHDRIVRAHDQILLAIKARKPTAARREMTRHLTDAQQALALRTQSRPASGLEPHISPIGAR